MPAADHTLDRDRFHAAWDPAIPPLLTVSSGATVTIATRDAANGKLRDRLTADDLARVPDDLRALLDRDAARYAADEELAGHALTGPIDIGGARPGDVLQIDVLAIEPADWGWTSFGPGFGLLAAEFPTRYTHVWDLRGGRDSALRAGVRVPLEPFCGVMGVAPDVPAPVSTVPPRAVGGNMDIKQLIAGATLYLPIAVAGARFSVGDVHAAQGDGEVCGTGIEMESTVTLRLTCRRDLTITGPQFELPSPLPGAWNTAGWYATTGHGPDLFVVTQDAIRQMIEHLVARRGLTREEAYVLCSVAVDLKISEVVDAPNWLVSALLPKGLFRDQDADPPRTNA